MDEATINLVRSRAKGRCEYCRIPEQYYTEFFQIEHRIELRLAIRELVGNSWWKR